MSILNSSSAKIHRGSGVIARWPNIVLVIPKQKTGNEQTTKMMVEALANDPNPELFYSTISAYASEIDSLGAVVDNHGTLSAVTKGDIAIVINEDQTIDGVSDLNIEEIMTDPITRFSIVPTASKDSAPVEPYDLRLGIAPGGAVTMTEIAAQDMTSDALPIMSNGENDTGENDTGENDTGENEIISDVEGQIETITFGDSTFKSALTTRTTPSRLAPLPLATADSAIPEPHAVEVEGVSCPRGHFNHPDITYCMICGISTDHLFHEAELGPRPTFAFIISDDGSTFGLSKCYSIGRNPDDTGDPTIEELRLYEDNETISRNHAKILLNGWSVTVIDSGSTNGTFIWNEEDESWEQVSDKEPVTITSGTTVALGRRAFVYESVEHNE